MAYLLVIEDDPDSAEVVATALRRAGHEVNCLPNGRQALFAILSRAPDVIVLDLLLPEMDGPSLLEVLRSYLRLQSISVVVLTALPADSPTVARARSLNVNTVLIKGASTPNDVLMAVETELARAAGGKGPSLPGGLPAVATHEPWQQMHASRDASLAQ